MRDTNGPAADSASLIAARQLAEDAHRRRLVAHLRTRRRHAMVIPPLPAARPAPGPATR